MRYFRTKTITAILFSLFFNAIFVNAQIDEDIYLTSCFDNYSFGSINLDKISPEKISYKVGEIVKFKGLVENKNSYPIVNGAIFARLIHLNSSENSFKNGDNIIDEFWVKENINILGGGAYPLEFNYKISEFAPGGRYRLATYFVVAKKFNLSGLSFVENIYGGLTHFEVLSPTRLNYYIDRNSITINGQEYSFRDYSPEISSNNANIEFTIRNQSDAKAAGQIIFELYKWDSLALQENLVLSEEQKIVIENKQFKRIAKQFNNLEPSAYLFKIKSLLNNQISIVNIRFVIEGKNGRINFIALKKFPLKKNELVEYFTCFHSSASSNKDFEGFVNTSFFDSDKKEIVSKTYEGTIYPDVYSYEGNFKVNNDVTQLQVKGFLGSLNNKAMDKVLIHYDCQEGRDIINELEFKQSQNKISVYGINWCGQKIATIFDSAIIKKKNSNELTFVQNNISSGELENIILEPGEYKGIFQSGQFILANDFIIIESIKMPLPIDSNNMKRNTVLVLLFVITVALVLATIFIFKKQLKKQ